MSAIRFLLLEMRLWEKRKFGKRYTEPTLMLN